MEEKRRIIVGITGASGPVMAYTLLQALRCHPQVEIHLVSTQGARDTLFYESDIPYKELVALAHVVHDEHDLAASISSGSFVTDGMVVIPCSMKSLAGIVSGYSDNLLLRAADVCLKERRKLVLAARESPLSTIHLRNLYELSQMGAVIVPPMLSYYQHPRTADDCTRQAVARLLAQFDLDTEGFQWEGLP